ncbi:hypothetical protein GCM10026987_04120 [Belliella aquatica]|uniref:Uncharacterized protein n=1 Tax=Belliella aquatica TaxID=1323734 RepID=A0ABQ1MDI4_9BACT|nr:hypothetical protein GCM10010993_15060 [Belliella aquatica]
MTVKPKASICALISVNTSILLRSFFIAVNMGNGGLGISGLVEEVNWLFGYLVNWLTGWISLRG